MHNAITSNEKIYQTLPLSKGMAQQGTGYYKVKSTHD